MKVVAFNGSPRKDGNTTILINHLFRELEKAMRECSGEKREIQLTDALDELRRRERILGLVIKGQKIDIGLPSGYLDGLIKFAGRA